MWMRTKRKRNPRDEPGPRRKPESCQTGPGVWLPSSSSVQEKQAPSAVERRALLARDSEKPTGISWEPEKLHMWLSPRGS